MLAAESAALASLCVVTAYWCNRRVFGFLPDDLPRPGRKQHRHPVPLAGIALAPAILTWLLLDQRWLLAAGVLGVATVGYVDDWSKERSRDLDWRIKLVVLACAAAIAAAAIQDPLADPGRFAAGFALVFVLTNAINFLDNTDGVAAAVAGVGLLLASGGDGPFAAVGCTALAFVPWNWPRPILFVGDSGAFALGMCAGAACIEQLPQPQAVLPFLIPFADFAQVVAARLLLGLRPWVGDRRHLTHIAQNLGVPQPAVAPLFALLVVACWWSLRGLA